MLVSYKNVVPWSSPIMVSMESLLHFLENLSVHAERQGCSLNYCFTSRAATKHSSKRLLLDPAKGQLIQTQKTSGHSLRRATGPRRAIMDVKDTVISGRPLQGYYPAELILGDRGDPTTSLTELIRSWTSELDSGVKRQGST